VSPLTTSATTSMAANVRRYWESATANVKYGVTKKKSKAATLRMDARTEAPRGVRIDTATTASRYTMMTFASSKRGTITQATAVAATTDPTASP